MYLPWSTHRTLAMRSRENVGSVAVQKGVHVWSVHVPGFAPWPCLNVWAEIVHNYPQHVSPCTLLRQFWRQRKSRRKRASSCGILGRRCRAAQTQKQCGSQRVPAPLELIFRRALRTHRCSNTGGQSGNFACPHGSIVKEKESKQKNEKNGHIIAAPLTRSLPD